MLVYDQPINPAKPEDRPARERSVRGLQRGGADPLAVAAKDHDRSGRADLRLPRRCDRQKPDAEISGDLPALRRSPGIAVGRPRTHAPRPGCFRPRHGRRKPGAPDHLQQRAASGDPGYPPGQGPRVRRRIQGHDGIAARPVRDRAPVRRRNQAWSDGGAGSPQPPHQYQEDRSQLHRRHRGLVVRPGEGGDARQRARPTPIWRNRRTRKPSPRGARQPTCRAASRS